MVIHLLHKMGGLEQCTTNPTFKDWKETKYTKEKHEARKLLIGSNHRNRELLLSSECDSLVFQYKFTSSST